MFSWSRRSGNGAAPSSSASVNPSLYPAFTGTATASQSQSSGMSRLDHLDSFTNDPILKRSTRKVSRDDSTYDTVFQTKSGNALILRTHVAPQEGVAPIMTLAGVVAVHPWLDARMRVIGYPPIVSDIQWSSFNITLGKAVNEVVQYFQLNPPTIQQITDQSLAKLQHQQQQPTHLRQPSQPPHYLGNPPPPTYEAAMQSDDFSPRSGEPFHMPIPAVPSTFPELNSMSQDQLKTLLNEQEAFSKYVDSMNAVTTITDLQTSIVEGNVDSAKANLARQEELETLHAEVSVLKSTLNERIAHFHKLEKRQKELSTPADPRTVVKQLQVVKREAFTESERIASDWLASDDSGGNSSTASVDDFLSAFMKKRELYHLRGAKIERLSGAH